MSVLKIRKINNQWEEITTIKGTDGVDGADGIDGVDGFSPIANVSQSGDTTTIAITDKNGTTSATINLSNYASKTYVDNLIGNINTVLATLTTPNNGGGN